MIQLYNVGIHFFGLLIRFVSLFNHKARLFVRGRKHWTKALQNIDSNQKTAWFHCSSLGEFEQGRPLIEKIKTQHPSWQILLTFFSPSGYEIRKNYKYADQVMYLPLDTPKNARRFIQQIQPNRVFFIKYEFWYFFLKELHRQNISTFLISGIFRTDQYFFQWYGNAFRKMIDWFEYIFVQDNSSLEVLQSCGYDNVQVSGDTRLDRVRDLVRNARELPLLDTFKQEQRLFIAGSTWPRDEELIFRFYEQFEKPFKMVIAPHEVHASNIARLEANLQKYTVVKYSEATAEKLQGADVLIVDSIGLLSALYRYGDYAYIGGGFGKGIHNLLEAATWGIPVVFGPNHHKFKEAHELIQRGGGFAVSDYPEMEAVYTKLLDNPSYMKNAGKAAQAYVEEHAGATNLILQKVFP